MIEAVEKLIVFDAPMGGLSSTKHRMLRNPADVKYWNVVFKVIATPPTLADTAGEVTLARSITHNTAQFAVAGTVSVHVRGLVVDWAPTPVAL
jgi:hypothetical protein